MKKYIIPLLGFIFAYLAAYHLIKQYTLTLPAQVQAQRIKLEAPPGWGVEKLVLPKGNVKAGCPPDFVCTFDSKEPRQAVVDAWWAYEQIATYKVVLEEADNLINAQDKLIIAQDREIKKFLAAKQKQLSIKPNGGQFPQYKECPTCLDFKSMPNLPYVLQ